MKRANRLMLVFGVILAVVSFVVVLAFGSFNQQPAQPVDPQVPVVVASQNLALGTSITPEMLATTTWAATDARQTYQHPEELIGLVVRRAVAQGAALTSDDFTSAVTVPELVRSIQPGLRAIAVPLSRVDSVGGLLQPGDFVDVILTINDLDGLNPLVIPNTDTTPTGIDGGSTAPYISIDEFVNNTTVKVVVQNVQVLAALPKEATDPSNIVSNPTAVEPDVIAILAVQPQQVEVIRFAELDGHVSLVLRSPSDYAQGQVTTTGITLWELVNRWGVLPPLPVTP
ncbi:MAG: Flp pilus assembly protein CpaB [Chloroflexota bacterium]